MRVALCILAALVKVAAGKVSVSLGICYDSWQELGAYSVMAKIALDEGYFDDVLPSNATKDAFTITLRTVDANCTVSGGATVALPLLLGEGKHPGRLYSDTADVEPVVGIAGCSCSDSSEPLSTMATRYQVPMVSGGSTSPALSNKGLHPYFARVIPPDSMQGKALASLVSTFGWQRVFAICTQDMYAQGIVSAFQARLAAFHDTSVFLYTLPTDAAEPSAAPSFRYDLWEQVATQIARGSPQPRIFFLAGSPPTPELAIRIFRKVGLVNMATVWMMCEAACSMDLLQWLQSRQAAYRIASQGDPWWDYPWQNTTRHLTGMMCLLPQFLGPKISTRRFQTFFSRLNRSKFEAAGWPSADVGWDDGWLSMDAFQGLVYNPLSFDSVVVFIMAIGSMLGRGVPAARVRGAALKAEVFAAQLEGITGVIGFDENGDRLAPYMIYNMRSAAGVPDLQNIGSYSSVLGRITWTSSPIFADGTTNVPSDRPAPCAPGYEFNMTVNNCVPCGPGNFSVGAESHCIPCGPGQYQNGTGQTACRLSPKGAFVSGTGAAAFVSCRAGTFGADQGAVACADCTPGSFAATDGQSVCEVAPAGTFVAVERATAPVKCMPGTFAEDSGATSCEGCPAGSFQPDAGQTACDVCHKNFYFADGTCRPCGPLHGTRGVGETSSDACQLTTYGVVLTVSCVAGGCFIFSLIAAVMARMKQRMRSFAEERERQTQQTVQAGLLTVREFGHPMVLVRMTDFMKLSWDQVGGLHEGIRDMGKLIILDTLDHVSNARAGGMNVIFFSYQWLSWDRCGPSALQFSWMKNAAVHYVGRGNASASDVCIWLDVLAIPQCHEGIKQLAVSSLYTYATAADALIIIAPDTLHANTGRVADLATYKSRIWTRAEQIAHLSCHDTSTIFIARHDGLEVISEGWLKGIVCIFEAEMTCCRLLHEGTTRCDKESLVLPMLGLWFILSAAAHHDILVPGQSPSGCRILYDLMQPQLDRVFPPTFEFVTKQGRETRMLFGDCIKRVEEYVKQQSTVALSSAVRTTAPTMRRSSTKPLGHVPLARACPNIETL